MRGVAFTDAQRQRVRVLHWEGRPLREIAAMVTSEFGVPRRAGTVSHLVKKLGLESRERTGASLPRLRKMHRDGLTPEQASVQLRKLFGIHRTPDSIASYWRRLDMARANPRGNTHWRGKLPIPTHVHPLVASFFKEMNKQMTVISEIEDRSGLSGKTVSDWRYRRMPRLDSFEAALNVLDLELVIRPRVEP